MLNAMFEHSNFPSNWINSFIHFVKKPDGLSFHPRSLTSCSAKIFEMLIKNRLEKFIYFFFNAILYQHKQTSRRRLTDIVLYRVNSLIAACKLLVNCFFYELFFDVASTLTKRKSNIHITCLYFAEYRFKDIFKFLLFRSHSL